MEGNLLKFSEVHHISLNVSDAQRDTAFYTDVLGFKAIPRPELPFKGAWLEMGQQQLHLLEIANFKAPKGQHFAFSVADIHKARDLLIAQAVKVSEPQEIKGVCLQCFFSDPSGNLLELNQPLPSRGAD